MHHAVAVAALADGSGSLEIREVLDVFGENEDAAEFIAYVDRTGDMALSLHEWMDYFFGFWRYHPGLARRNVAFLMQRAAELQMAPSRPPPENNDEAEAEAATKVQALIRGKVARQERDAQAAAARAEQEAAATKMQAISRGRKSRGSNK